MCCEPLSYVHARINQEMAKGSNLYICAKHSDSYSHTRHAGEDILPLHKGLLGLSVSRKGIKEPLTEA